MSLHTASEGIAFAKRLEKQSAALYVDLAAKWPSLKETFLAFAQENERRIPEIDRTYYGVITDAIEGGYCFNLDSSTYHLNVQSLNAASLPDAVSNAIRLEETVIRFYVDAAEQSEGLLADVPRLFTTIAKRHKNRLEVLEAKLSEEV